MMVKRRMHHSDNQHDDQLRNALPVHHVFVGLTICRALAKELQADDLADAEMLVNLLPITSLALDHCLNENKVCVSSLVCAPPYRAPHK